MIAGLGKLAAGAPVEDVSSTVAAPATTAGAPRAGEADDVEMVDVSASTPAPGTPTSAPAPAPAAVGGGGSSGVSKGGKGKKKGGKGKR